MDIEKLPDIIKDLNQARYDRNFDRSDMNGFHRLAGEYAWYRLEDLRITEVIEAAEAYLDLLAKVASVVGQE